MAPVKIRESFHRGGPREPKRGRGRTAVCTVTVPVHSRTYRCERFVKKNKYICIHGIVFLLRTIRVGFSVMYPNRFIRIGDVYGKIVR